MKTNMLKRARAHFDHPGVPRSTVRHNIRGWTRSVRFLMTSSSKQWLLATPVQRKGTV